MLDGMPEHRAIARAGVNRLAERFGHARVVRETARSSKFKLARRFAGQVAACNSCGADGLFLRAI
jgi:hypothetical protein